MAEIRPHVFLKSYISRMNLYFDSVKVDRVIVRDQIRNKNATTMILVVFILFEGSNPDLLITTRTKFVIYSLVYFAKTKACTFFHGQPSGVVSIHHAKKANEHVNRLRQAL